jgi:hypothetical protein
MNSEHVKNGLVILSVGSIIVGFFQGIVSSEIFYATVGGIITHFYQSGKITDLKDKVESQRVEIQSQRVELTSLKPNG